MKNQKGNGAAQAASEGSVTIENPLLEPVEEKSYAQANVQVDPTKLQQSIPEPQYIAPNVEDEEDLFAPEEDQTNSQQQTAGATKTTQPEFNKTLNELSPKDQARSAEHAASLFFAGYQKMHDAGNWWISISDDQLIKLQMEGELDTTIQVPYTSEDWIPVMQFIQTYNEQAKNFFKIDPEWRAEVEPALIRVLKKYKIGMSDEQFLAVKFGEDLISKGIQARLMRGTCKSILEFAKEESKAARQRQQPAPLTSVPGGQPDQQQQPYQETAANPQQSQPGGQPIYQSPVDMQDHVGAELRTQSGGNSPMEGVERSDIPVFGDEKLLKNLNKVSRKRSAGAKKSKSNRPGKSRS